MVNFPSPAKAVSAVFFLSLVLWAFGTGGKLPAITDVFLHTTTSQNANLVELSKGSVPLWDPSVGCGTPQLASGLGACFYPPYWLWNLTGLSDWMVRMSLFHAAFAFLGFYLWSRSLAVAPLWSSLAALSFAGSQHMVRLWGYPIFLSSQAWTPWVFWAASRYFGEGKFRWGAGLALAAGAQILAGYPFFSFYTLAFLMAWVLSLGMGPRRLGGFGLSLTAAFAWTSVHWLPFLDFIRRAQRDDWGSPDRFPYFTRAAECLTLLSPTALGKPETVDYLGRTANANFMLYFGLIPLAALLWGSFRGKFPARIFWTFAPLFWLLWMTGTLGAFFPEKFLEALNPSKAVGVFLFAACTGAGLSLTSLFRGWGEGKAKRAAGWAVCGLWLLDLLLVPVRTLHWVPDPFLKPEVRQWAERVKAEAGGKRLISLQSKDRLVARGAEGKVFEEASDGWVKGLLANSQQYWGMRSVQAYLSLWNGSMEKLWRAFNRKDTYDGELPDLAGIKLLYFPLELPSPHYRTLERTGDGFLIENMSCKEDAWTAKEGVLSLDQDAILARLSLPVRGAGKSGEIYLEEGQKLDPPPRPLEGSGGSWPKGFSRPSSCLARFQGPWAGDHWLVWNEAFSPGWKAWVNGAPAPLYRAEGFFMGVPLSSSSGWVEFRYEPSSFRLGLFLSLISLVLAAGGAGFRLSGKDRGFPDGSGSWGKMG